MLLASHLEPKHSRPVQTSRSEDASRAHWVSVVSHLDPRYGGLSSVVPQLSSRLVLSHQLRVDLAAFCEEEELYCADSNPEITITEWPASRLQWLSDRSLRDRFRNLLESADGVHIHGLWEQSTATGVTTARALRKPYILSAHGMLEPWALSNKRFKKKLYAALFERANVCGAACLHALTHAEARDYRRFGATGPIAVIPNGVTLPSSLAPDTFLEQFPFLRGKRILLFLGRIHYKKGLELLVESWSELAFRHPEAHLVLAGPDFEGTKARIEKLIGERGLSERVTFTGMLRQELKWSALAAAQCFVLPSYSEGLSVSVLEAMGIGLPVIITEQCNLPEVKQLGAGWEIQSEVGQLTSAIQDFLSNSIASNVEIGTRGRTLVRTRYDWDTVSESMAELYLWVGGGPRPQTVEIITG